MNARGPHGSIQACGPRRTIIARMRRPLIAVLVVALSATAAGPAAAALSITPGAVRMLLTPPDTSREHPAPALAAHVGGAYRFEVGYSVAGAPRIATGHRFVFEELATGERRQVLAKSFAPGPPGPYRESSVLEVPAGWSPGVYRLRWTVTARSPRLEPVRATGSRVFLVVG